MDDVSVKNIELKLSQSEKTINHITEIVNSDFNFATESKKQLRDKMDQIIDTLNAHNDKLKML